VIDETLSRFTGASGTIIIVAPLPAAEILELPMTLKA
jgi:hypothetical protein